MFRHDKQDDEQDVTLEQLKTEIALLKERFDNIKSVNKKAEKDRKILAFGLILVAFFAISLKVEVDLGWFKVKSSETSDQIEFFNTIQTTGLLSLLFGGAYWVSKKESDDDQNENV